MKKNMQGKSESERHMLITKTVFHWLSVVREFKRDTVWY